MARCFVYYLPGGIRVWLFKDRIGSTLMPTETTNFIVNVK